MLSIARVTALAFVLTSAIWAVAVAPAAAQEKRVALVIGNGQYRTVSALPNPANAVAAALKRLGFSEVVLATDLDYGALRAKLSDFSAITQDAELALVFYAGHGMEIAGENYLIPIDAKLARSKDAALEAVTLRQVQTAVEDIKGTGVIILDACRNNPFISRMADPGGHRSISPGLARPSTRGKSTLIVYAARDGTTAYDGEGGNSPFTAALLKHIEKPLEVDLLFRTVRDDVIAATGPEDPQEPFTYGSLGALPVYLKPPPEPGKVQREPSLDEYRMQFRTALLEPEVDQIVDWHRMRIQQSRARYEAVEKETSVPWVVVAILHAMESGLNFKTHLHNGDPLSARTVQVPAGRPQEGQPPFTWEQSAIDSLRFDKWDKRAKLWTVEDALSAFERYNGFGSRRHGVVSAYLWSGSSHYTSGKFVADGVFDPKAKSKQVGAGVLLKYAIPVQELERRLNYRGE